MSKRARIDRLAHAQASASAAVQPVSIEVPDIITFVTSPQFLNRPKLYPRQALVLKVMFVALELLTPYDYAVLAKWGAGFRPVGETGDRRYQGTEGLPPDVLARMAACRASGRRWFRETVLVIGRRGSKGHLSALAAAYVLWTYLALENPQGHYGIERTKRLTGMIFAGERSQPPTTCSATSPASSAPHRASRPTWRPAPSTCCGSALPVTCTRMAGVPPGSWPLSPVW